ncbi:MAG: NHL repeat-containing protein [candidate division Zixibacteria bacterium]|nr:NHL repeat-containing protein [candidate division Zixibacteria bacterium]
MVEQQVSGAILGKTLKSPSALAVGERGNLYLIDAGNKRVVWFDAHLTPVRDFSGEGGTSGRLSEPTGLTVDAQGTLWITDSGRRLLVRCSDKLEYVGEIDPKDDQAPQELIRPAGIAITDFGEIWVADSDNNRIAVLDVLGQIDHFVGDFTYPGGALRRPSKLLYDRHDKIYVCDTDNRRIVVYDDRGSLIMEIEHPALEDPVAVALDGHGWIWTLDQNSGRVHCFNQDGHYLTTLGPIVSGTEQPLVRPSDLAFTPDGRLVISDTGNNRLLVCQFLYGIQ